MRKNTSEVASRWLQGAGVLSGSERTQKSIPDFIVYSSAPVKLQILVPGVTAVEGDVSNNGRTGDPDEMTAGLNYTATVNLTDPYWNKVISLGSDTTVQITASAPYYNQPASNYLEAGERLFTLAVLSSGSWTATSSDVDGVPPLYTADTSASIPVISSGAVKLQVLLPGETAVPGSGKTGTPSNRTAGLQFTITVNGVDPNWNIDSNASQQVNVVTTDLYDGTISGNNLQNGFRTFNITNVTAGSVHKSTATDASGNPVLLADGYSAYWTVVASASVRLQLLMPNQTAQPGSSAGKTGTPSAQYSNVPFKVTVNATDPYWNISMTGDNDTAVRLTTNDE
ncbi:MAG: hypothetical protein Q7K21_03580, partial [Elusimicrobiota bacterium]|nr:hypothetical protein [Elusimicrobiota bacterium]